MGEKQKHPVMREAASGIPFQLLHQPYHPAGAAFCVL